MQSKAGLGEDMTPDFAAGTDSVGRVRAVRPSADQLCSALSCMSAGMRHTVCGIQYAASKRLCSMLTWQVLYACAASLHGRCSTHVQQVQSLATAFACTVCSHILHAIPFEEQEPKEGTSCTVCFLCNVLMLPFTDSNSWIGSRSTCI